MVIASVWTRLNVRKSWEEIEFRFSFSDMFLFGIIRWCFMYYVFIHSHGWSPFYLGWVACQSLLCLCTFITVTEFGRLNLNLLIGTRVQVYHWIYNLSLLITIGFRCRCTTTKTGLSFITVYLVLRGIFCPYKSH